VAEALVDLRDPLEGLLSPGPAASPGEVARALARSLAPAEADRAVPPWLRPDQAAPFRRALAAMERHGAALLADPVGSGKTYVALAVAAVLRSAAPTVAIVPASLKPQWQRTSSALGVAVALHSHEALSRGRLPDARAGLAVIDESHRFRSPGTRRYREIARWLVGKRILLLSATPVVNRLGDLSHQLRLGLRDDALAHRGIRSLAAMLERGEASPALGDVVLCRARPADRPVARRSRLSWKPATEDAELLRAIDALTLSRDGGTAALLRMVMWRALGSSRAALAAALDRYHRLLDHAAHAAAAGRPVTRAAIRAFSDGTLDQLVLWELLPPIAGASDLAPGDGPALARLDAMLAGGKADRRLDAMRALLADRRPTLVFTGSRDTLTALRGALTDLRPAWVTGAGAGIGHVRMPRERVLGLFRPCGVTRRAAPSASALPPSRPSVLLATDVAAEGLDLQLAERVVHFDLPWTSVRVDQREGRAVRLGAGRAEIQVVSFTQWPELEERLRLDSRLLAKRRLVTIAGLDDDGRWLFRWRAEVAEAAGPGLVAPGLAIVAGPADGWLIGLALDLVSAEGTVRHESASLLWLEPAGEVIEDPAVTSRLLRELGGLESLRPASAADRAEARRCVMPVVRARLADAGCVTWLARQAPAEQRRLARRMRRIAAEAARRRDRELLSLAGTAIDWLAGGVTAGEAALLGELAALPAAQLPSRWQRLLRSPRVRLIPVPRLTGILRVTSFPPCPPSVRCCSTSTAPSSTPSS
jgi:Helicase conserved C-terminal domain